MGARNSGMGGATTTLGDQWSLFNNVAGLGLVDGDYAFSSYQSRFGIKELQTIGAGFVHGFGKSTIGGGVFRFGDALFSEQRVSVGIGHQLDRVSLGISAGYLQYNISTVGSKGTLIIEFGGIANITEELSFGAHIFNVNQTSLVAEQDERIPTVMKAGLSYQPNEELILSVETEKDLDFDEVIRVGLEYQIVEDVFVRTGLNTEPFIGAFGIGFYPKNFQIDYSFSNDPNLGSIHEFSFSYVFSKP